MKQLIGKPKSASHKAVDRKVKESLGKVALDVLNFAASFKDGDGVRAASDRDPAQPGSVGREAVVARDLLGVL